MQYNQNSSRAKSFEQFDPTQFLNQFVESFDLEEIKTICFRLQIDFDSLRGEGKVSKVRELVRFCIKNNRLPDLTGILCEERAHLSWPGAETILTKASLFEERLSKNNIVIHGNVDGNAIVGSQPNISINKFFDNGKRLLFIAIIAICAITITALFSKNLRQYFYTDQSLFLHFPTKTFLPPNTPITQALVPIQSDLFESTTHPVTSTIAFNSTLTSTPTPTQRFMEPTSTNEPRLNSSSPIEQPLLNPTTAIVLTQLPIPTSTVQPIPTSTNTVQPTSTMTPSMIPTETIVPTSTPTFHFTPTIVFTPTPTPLIPTITTTPTPLPSLTPTVTQIPSPTPNFGVNSITFRTYSQIGDYVGSPENIYDTQIPVDAFDCGIIGFKATGGDINEKGSGDIILLNLYPQNNSWHIRADFLTHYTQENWTVHTICVDKAFSNNYLFAHLSNLGNHTSISLQISNDDYHCAVIGMAAEDGDIQENGTADIFSVKVYKGLIDWELEYDFNSHGDHENWTIDVICFDTTQPQWFLAKEYERIGDKVNTNTGISSSEYVCGISGIAANDGDIQENGSDGDLIYAYLENINGTWWIRADFRSHYTDESWDVNILCFSHEIAIDYGQVN